RRLCAHWQAFYPPSGLDARTQALFAALQSSMPAFVTLLVNHRPRALRGRSLMDVMDTQAREPARLSALYETWSSQPPLMYRAAPALVFATIGQARADGRLGPEDESALLSKVLTYWALRATLNISEICASTPAAERRAA